MKYINDVENLTDSTFTGIDDEEIYSLPRKYSEREKNLLFIFGAILVALVGLIIMSL